MHTRVIYSLWSNGIGEGKGLRFVRYWNPFRLKTKSAKKANNLWMHLARLEEVRETFIQYIFTNTNKVCASLHIALLLFQSVCSCTKFIPLSLSLSFSTPPILCASLSLPPSFVYLHSPSSTLPLLPPPSFPLPLTPYPPPPQSPSFLPLHSLVPP